MKNLSRLLLLAACLSTVQLANAANDLAALDRKIAALEERSGVAAADYYRQVRALLDSLNRADVPATERYERIVAEAERALSRNFDTAAVPDLVIAEKRNVALYLLGAPLLDVKDAGEYARLRNRFAESLVRFVTDLKRDRIAGYRPERVSISMPLMYRANAAADGRQRRAADEAVMRRAAYQDSLASELALLMPRVRNFVETQYAYTPSDRRALDRFLEALSD